MSATTIGQLAKKSGCSAQSIRHYEQIGLLPQPDRTPGNRRLYGRNDAARLAFIRHSRRLGLSLEAIRSLIVMGRAPDASCAEADWLIRARLSEVEAAVTELRSLAHELEAMLERCRGGRIAECEIIASLGDHRLCGDHTGPPAVPTPTAWHSA